MYINKIKLIDGSITTQTSPESLAKKVINKKDWTTGTLALNGDNTKDTVIPFVNIVFIDSIKMEEE